MAAPEEQSFFSLLTSMQLGKLIILSPPFIRLDQFLREKRKLYLMPGMVTTVSRCTLMIDTIPHSSLHGGATGIALPLKATMLQVMATPGDMMKSQPPSLTKPNVLMTPYCGQIQSKTASVRLHTGLTHVENMGSLSTPQNFALLWMRLNLQVLK